MGPRRVGRRRKRGGDVTPGRAAWRPALAGLAALWRHMVGGQVAAPVQPCTAPHSQGRAAFCDLQPMCLATPGALTHACNGACHRQRLPPTRHRAHPCSAPPATSRWNLDSNLVQPQPLGSDAAGAVVQFLRTAAAADPSLQVLLVREAGADADADGQRLQGGDEPQAQSAQPAVLLPLAGEAVTGKG